MYSRRLPQLAVAGATVAAALAFAFADPASASVSYDPGTRTGFVDRDGVRTAFGWTDAVLAARASGLVFDHNFWTDDNYSVACGGKPFPVVHHRVFGRFELTDVTVRDGRRGRTGYGGGLVGFRLAGAHLGISGTSVPPMTGQPCPADEGQAAGSAIEEVRLVSSTTGWSLSVRSGDVDHQILANDTPNR